MMRALPTRVCPVRKISGGEATDITREVIGETPVALIVDGGAEAVMMATAVDLHDFAVGFSLTEGLIETPDDIRDLDIVETDLGVELRIWLHAGARNAHAARRRRRAGPVGCGLCGVESLEEAMRPLPAVHSETRMEARQLIAAMGLLAGRQVLNRSTRAAHAAGFFTPAAGVSLAREDIGRHNALDKLIGALAREGAGAHDGAIVMTSRISVELVQKAAIAGAPILAAISAPSSLAVETANTGGITLVGVVRDDGLEVFTHEQRIC